MMMMMIMKCLRKKVNVFPRNNAANPHYYSIVTTPLPTCCRYFVYSKCEVLNLDSIQNSRFCYIRVA